MRLVLDANLVVLLVVGDVDPAEIVRHKRLSGYEARDHALLLGVLKRFRPVGTYPNVLTEASNLLRQCPEGKRKAFGAGLAVFADGAGETYHLSRNATGHRDYFRLGLTDAVLLQSLGAEDHLLTADLDLYLAAWNAGRNAQNFSHLRVAAFGV